MELSKIIQKSQLYYKQFKESVSTLTVGNITYDMILCNIVQQSPITLNFLSVQRSIILFIKKIIKNQRQQSVIGYFTKIPSDILQLSSMQSQWQIDFNCIQGQKIDRQSNKITIVLYSSLKKRQWVIKFANGQIFNIWCDKLNHHRYRNFKVIQNKQNKQDIIRNNAEQSLKKIENATNLKSIMSVINQLSKIQIGVILQVKNTEIIEKQKALKQQLEQTEEQSNKQKNIMQQTIQFQQSKYTQLNDQLTQLKNKNKSQIQSLTFKIKQMENQIIQMQQQFSRRQFQNRNLNNCKLNQMANIIEIHSLNQSKQKIELQEKQQQIRQIKEYIQNQEQERQSLKQQYQQQLNRQQEHINQIKKLVNRLETFTNNQYLHIFQGQAIFNPNIQAKQFLRRSIEEYMNRTIEYTRKVYKYDTLNKISFHSYVDGIPFLCTVIRTVNDDLLAAFSVDPLRSNVVIGSQGLLVSMTNSTVYRCQQGRRSMTYDDFFLIYGNSEMRIRMGDNKLFSNFGMNGGYFESRGDSVDSYIGSNTNRETYFVTYEVYEIIFKEE